MSEFEYWQKNPLCVLSVYSYVWFYYLVEMALYRRKTEQQQWNWHTHLWLELSFDSPQPKSSRKKEANRNQEWEWMRRKRKRERQTEIGRRRVREREREHGQSSTPNRCTSSFWTNLNQFASVYWSTKDHEHWFPFFIFTFYSFKNSIRSDFVWYCMRTVYLDGFLTKKPNACLGVKMLCIKCKI